MTGRRRSRIAAFAGLWPSLACGTGLAVLAATGVAAQGAGPAWSTSFSTDLRFFSWRSVRQIPGAAAATIERGTQFVAPLSAQLTGRPNADWKVEFLLRGGIASSQVKIGAASGSYTGVTDTTASGTVTYYGFTGFQPFFSLATNLPTGETVLRGANANTKPDPDNAFLPVYGEGFNIGPTLGVTLPFNDFLTGSLSVGYTNRGRFDREGPTILGIPTTTAFDPGDVTTVSAGLNYRGEQLSLKANAAFSVETETKRDGLPFYRSGNRLLLVLGAGYAFTENWSARLQGSLSLFGKNEVRVLGLPALQQEAFNSNSALTKIVADVTYARDNWSIGPTASFLYRDRNGYDPTAFEFVTAKTAWSAGFASSWAPTPTSRLTFRVERLWSHENSSPDKVQFGLPIPLSGNPKVEMRGWQVSLGGNVKF